MRLGVLARRVVDITRERAVNILAQEDTALSTHFARPSPDKFAAFANRFFKGIQDLPLLQGAVATFEYEGRALTKSAEFMVQ